MLAVPEESQKCRSLLYGDVTEAEYALSDVKLLEVSCDVVYQFRGLPFLRLRGDTGSADGGECQERTLLRCLSG